MYKKIIFCILSLTFFKSSHGQGNVKVEINENVELLTIVQYLGDRAVYPMNSIYLREVDSYFKPFKKEKAVKAIKEIFNKENGDATFPQLGAYCSKLPEFKKSYPLTKFNDTIQKIEYLNACKDFANKSNFHSFYNNPNLKTNLWIQQVVDTITQYQLTQRLESFMGKKRDWNIYLSPLVGWGAYNFIIPTGNEVNEIHFVMGYNVKYNKDDKSAMNDQPFFAKKDNLIDLVWHEGSHSYISPLIEQNKEFLSNYTGILTEAMQEPLQKAGRFKWQWDYYFNELIVRAIVAKLIDTHFGKEASILELEKQKAKGFIHIANVYKILVLYEQNKEKNIEVFFELLKQDLKKW